MNIPDKATDAAFRAATGGAELHLDDRMYWEQVARDMLEAAAPFIAAQALRDEAEAAQEDWNEQWDEMDADYAPAAVVTIDELRLRADEMDPQ